MKNLKKSECKADSGEDADLTKYIDDFKALYLNIKVEFTP